MWNIFKKSIDRAKVKPAAAPTSQIKRVPENAKVTEATQDKINMARAEKIFLKPVVTEKTSSLGIYNTYGFVVAGGANKIAIKKAFQEVYGKRPDKITIMNAKPKTKVFRKRAGVKPGFKKALIRLPAGVKVDIFEGV